MKGRQRAQIALDCACSSRLGGSGDGGGDNDDGVEGDDDDRGCWTSTANTEWGRYSGHYVTSQ